MLESIISGIFYFNSAFITIIRRIIMVKNNDKRGFLDSFFKLKENGTTVKTEVIAGITLL